MLLVRSFFYGNFCKFIIAKSISKICKTRLSVAIPRLVFQTRLRDLHFHPYCKTSLQIHYFYQKFKILPKMKVIQIKAKDFFEFIKLKDTSMWEIFSQMIDGEEKEIIFLDEEEKILFNYILPQNLEKLEEDRKTFAKEYADKISNLN